MHMGSFFNFLYEAHGQLERKGFDTVLKDTTAGQIITDMRGLHQKPSG